MFNMNWCLLSLGIPAAISTFAAFYPSPWIYVLLFLSHFIVVGKFSVFGGYENWWMFVAVTISSIPVNISLILLLKNGDLSNIVVLDGRIVFCIFIYLGLFIIEQIFMGLITRIIWRKQRNVEL